MRDYITLGPVPCDEDCAQVGQDDYPERSRAEYKAYFCQLRRQFGKEPGGAMFSVKSFPHDFGSYREVVVYYDNENEASVDFAYKVEGELPGEWDEEARKELGLEVA
ncbi:MAG: hypothetical protein KKG25_16320 [Bacteroidetes bacterium]|nr:hypothetical protein [Bacteroidota bacterium]MBU1486415.1 hypothetical protein [Bacteroidota bacterium]